MRWHRLLIFSVPDEVLVILQGQLKCHSLCEVFGPPNSTRAVTCICIWASGVLFTLLWYSKVLSYLFLSPVPNLCYPRHLLTLKTTKAGGSYSVLPRPTESHHGSLLEMQILRLHPRSTNLETLGVGSSPPGDSDTY